MRDEMAMEPMLGALLRAPLRALAQRVAVDLAAAGFVELRPSHLVVFQQLGPRGNRLTELAAGAQMTKQSMGALVDDLQRWGYIERIPDDTDGRARIIRRTSRGWEVEKAARASVGAFDAEWTRRVGDKRMQEFRRVLEEFGAVQAEEDAAET